MKNELIPTKDLSHRVSEKTRVLNILIIVKDRRVLSRQLSVCFLEIFSPGHFRALGSNSVLLWIQTLSPTSLVTLNKLLNTSLFINLGIIKVTHLIGWKWELKECMLCNIKLLGVLKKREKKDEFCRKIHYEPQEFLYLKKKKEKSQFCLGGHLLNLFFHLCF